MNGRLFVNLETGTVDPLDASAYVLDVDRLDDDMRAALERCEDFGSFDPRGVDVVEAVAMPLEAVVDVVEVLRRVAVPSTIRSLGWVGVGTLRGAVSMVDADLDGPLLEVRDAAVAELRRALLILDTLASSTLDAEAMLDVISRNLFFGM